MSHKDKELRNAATKVKAILEDLSILTSEFWDQYPDGPMDLEAYTLKKAELTGSLRAYAMGLVINVEVYCDEV